MYYKKRREIDMDTEEIIRSRYQEKMIKQHGRKNTYCKQSSGYFLRFSNKNKCIRMICIMRRGERSIWIEKDAGDVEMRRSRESSAVEMPTTDRHQDLPVTEKHLNALLLEGDKLNLRSSQLFHPRLCLPILGNCYPSSPISPVWIRT